MEKKVALSVYTIPWRFSGKFEENYEKSVS
jgi:hypothetical protein